MLPKRLSGQIHIDKQGRARFETSQGILTLIPYPEGAPLARKEMEVMGKMLFSYLNNKTATVSGEISGSRLFNAHLTESKLPIKDVTLGPRGNDKFSQSIEQYFKRDSEEIAAKLNLAGISTVSASYHRVKNYQPEIDAFSKFLKVPRESIKSFLAALDADQRIDPW